MRELERRYLARPMEWRAAGDGAGLGTLHGYAAVFNSYSQNLGGFVEAVAPTAFNKTLADGGRVLCRYNHDDNQLLGTTDADTLRLEVDGTGLAYDVDLPDTTAGNDCSVLARRLDLRYSSFAFYCIEDEWTLTPQDFLLRTIIQAQLIDVAPVNSPAYLDSSAAMRSLTAALTGPLVEARSGKPLDDYATALLRGVRVAAAKADEPFQPLVEIVHEFDELSRAAAEKPAAPVEEGTQDDGPEQRSEPGDQDTEPRETHSVASRQIDLLRMQLADLK